MSSGSDPALGVSDQDYRRVTELLFREAQLLDAGRFKEWLTLLAEDMRYRLVAPTVSMLKPGAKETPGNVLLMDETLGSLKTRVQQLSTPAYTIAENPRSFARRFVTNILIDRVTDEGLIQVNSNVLVYRSRDMQTQPHLFSVSRTDTLRKVAGGFCLAQRSAQLDEAVVSARNISTLF